MEMEACKYFEGAEPWFEVSLHYLLERFDFLGEFEGPFIDLCQNSLKIFKNPKITDAVHKRDIKV